MRTLLVNVVDIAGIVRISLVNVVDIAGVRRPVLCAGAVHACARLLIPCSRCVYLLFVPLLHMLALCAIAFPMLALHARAVRARAVRARAVRFRAGRVVCLWMALACPHAYVPAMLY